MVDTVPVFAHSQTLLSSVDHQTAVVEPMLMLDHTIFLMRLKPTGKTNYYNSIKYCINAYDISAKKCIQLLKTG